MSLHYHTLRTRPQDPIVDSVEVVDVFMDGHRSPVHSCTPERWAEIQRQQGPVPRWVPTGWRAS